MNIPAVTLIVLIAQDVLYGLILLAMWKSNKASKISAEAAIKSAEAATGAVANARETERAIILIDTVEMTMHTPASGADGSSVVIITLKNFGRTIANAVNLTGAIVGFGQFPIAKSPPTTIAPEGTNSWITQPLGQWLTDNNILIVNRSDLLGYKIDVTYSDIFGSHSYHCEGRYEPSVKRFLITGSKTD